MPFSPQPRKKGTPSGSQESTKKPSCGHTVPQLSCKTCPAPGSGKVVQLHPPNTPKSEKQKILVLREKVAGKFAKDERAAEKAAIILADWVNRQTKKK